jgi:tripartite-type tricarboxylate transporter receptor subunit TctC
MLVLIAAGFRMAPVHAQPFPMKPVHIIVPFAPGGAADLTSRVLADYMAKGLGQPVIVDNRPGAGGVFAYDLSARLPPDGQTMTVVFPSLVIHPLIRQVRYDAVKDFKGVSQTASLPIAVAVHPSVPVKTWKELVALARPQPDSFAYGTSGVGTLQHVFGEMLALQVNVRFRHVPYSSSLPTAAVAGGEIPMVIANVVEIAPFAASHKVRPIVVSTPDRAEALPEVPTFREAGYPQLETTNWSGMVVPALTPAVIVARLNAEIVRALRMPELQQRFRTQGLSAAPSTPEEFQALLASEASRYGDVVRRAGIKAQ